ncbi:MAG: hypothetical protein PVI03_06705 [Candidatus Thorarchaeota archaeon]
MAKKKSVWTGENIGAGIIIGSGLIALFGATLAIFDVPYGSRIGMAGALWFVVSFLIALLWVAVKEEDKKKGKKK